MSRLTLGSRPVQVQCHKGLRVRPRRCLIGRPLTFSAAAWPGPRSRATGADVRLSLAGSSRPTTAARTCLSTRCAAAGPAASGLSMSEMSAGGLSACGPMPCFQSQCRVHMSSLWRPRLIVCCFPQTSIVTDGFRSLADGETVEFYVESGDDGRTKAVQVTGPGGAPPQGARPPCANCRLANCIGAAWAAVCVDLAHGGSEEVAGPFMVAVLSTVAKARFS